MHHRPIASPMPPMTRCQYRRVPHRPWWPHRLRSVLVQVRSSPSIPFHRRSSHLDIASSSHAVVQVPSPSLRLRGGRMQQPCCRVHVHPRPQHTPSPFIRILPSAYLYSSLFLFPFSLSFLSAFVASGTPAAWLTCTSKQQPWGKQRTRSTLVGLCCASPKHRTRHRPRSVRIHR